MTPPDARTVNPGRPVTYHGGTAVAATPESEAREQILDRIRALEQRVDELEKRGSR